MFNFFKKKQNNTYMLGAVAKGKVVELKEVNDPTFNSGMLGRELQSCRLRQNLCTGRWRDRDGI